MNAGRTARERARAELTSEIKREARRQLVDTGADGLSLRAVARELGMVSSALYRYFPSRDDLLTALIMDAYESLAGAAEAADDPAAGPRERMRAVCAAIRGWSRARPQEYALIYGSPVPGYRAPEVTVAPAARIPLVLVGIVRASWTADNSQAPATTPMPAPMPAPMPPMLAEQLRVLGERVTPGMPADLLVRALLAWTQLFGIISFELFGQLVGSVNPSDAFFEHAVGLLSDSLDLPPTP